MSLTLAQARRLELAAIGLKPGATAAQILAGLRQHYPNGTSLVPIDTRTGLPFTHQTAVAAGSNQAAGQIVGGAGLAVTLGSLAGLVGGDAAAVGADAAAGDAEAGAASSAAGGATSGAAKLAGKGIGEAAAGGLAGGIVADLISGIDWKYVGVTVVLVVLGLALAGHGTLQMFHVRGGGA